MKMKIILILLCIIISNNAQLDKDFVLKFVQKILNTSEACLTESQASKDDVQSLLEHKIPENHEGKCLIFCFHKHFHIQETDGHVDKDKAMATLGLLKEHNPEIYEKVVEVFNKCLNSAHADNDPCVYATYLLECAIKEGKSMGLDELLVID